MLGLLGAVCFHAAYTPAKSGPLALLIIGYVVCLIQLARLKTTRQCFYTGLGVGFACFAPQLECFWRIFGAGAIALWLILAFWIGLFVALTHVALARLGLKRAALLIPFLWTGLEYFRSELYYLRFSWLNVGYAYADWQMVPFKSLGMFGVGFLAAAFAAAWFIVRLKHILSIRFITYSLIFGFIAVFVLPAFAPARHRPRPDFLVAGVQLEFPSQSEIINALDKIVADQPTLKVPSYFRTKNLDLIVLPEYTLDGEPTEALKDWCRENEKFLIVGCKDSSPGTNYFNTAFVISTNGEVVFKQVKSVPIQFFKDGLPAPEQKIWESPWGKIGICICYDLSYVRVTDELVRQGAQMLIVPTMDVEDWGQHQHELHARVAPVRAAEYGVPIFRLASSGISQGVNRTGWVQSTAPFRGEGEVLVFGAVLPKNGGSLPMDRWLAPLCVVVTALFVVWLIADNFRRKRGRRSKGNPA